MVGEGVSARLLAGAGAVLRREGLVRALDVAPGRPFRDPRAVLGGVAVLVPGLGIFARGVVVDFGLSPPRWVFALLMRSPGPF